MEWGGETRSLFGRSKTPAEGRTSLSTVWQLTQAKQWECHFLPMARVTVLVRITWPQPLQLRPEASA
jgi:hypothetical protein